MCANDLGQIVAPLKDAVVLLDPIAAVVASETSDREVWHDAKTIARQELLKGDTQSGSFQNIVLRMSDDDVVRQAEAEVVEHRWGKRVRRIDGGNVGRPRTAARHNSEIAALKCIENDPLI